MFRDARPIIALLLLALATTAYLACGSDATDDTSGGVNGVDFDGAVHRDVNARDQSSDAPSTVN